MPAFSLMSSMKARTPKNVVHQPPAKPTTTQRHSTSMPPVQNRAQVAKTMPKVTPRVDHSATIQKLGMKQIPGRKTAQAAEITRAPEKKITREALSDPSALQAKVAIRQDHTSIHRQADRMSQPCPICSASKSAVDSGIVKAAKTQP